MHDRSPYYIPRRLDDQGKLLFWDIDQAIIVVAGLLIGLYSMNLWVLAISIPSGVLLAGAYGRLKAGRHPGMAKHFIYWWTGQPPMRITPHSASRELIG